VCGKPSVDVCTVLWWVRRIKEAETGGAELHDKLWRGCSCSAVMCDNICQVDELICGNCHITNELFFNLSISKGSVVAVIE
jgi:hypothetical protein